MITQTREDESRLVEQLTYTLVKFSDGKLSYNKAEYIANETLKNADFTNSTLAHKGINWYAKEILKKIDY